MYRMINVTARLALLMTFSFWLSGCEKEADDDSKYSGDKFRENIRSTEARTPEEERAGLKVPPGFEVTLFASEPNIDKPINLAFDSKGRLWVTSSFEYPFPSSNTPRGTDRITMVEDTDHDGKGDRFTDVVDTVNIPIGILPLQDGAVTYSLPSVYKYTDTDNDGKVDNQNILFGPFGYQDTHGMVSNFMRGYDGWVHVCHGFTNRSTIAGTDGDSIRMVSGNTFRFRLDGSRVEQMTFGQVNPFGLVFDAMGYVYSTDSHSSPLYQLIRGGDYPHFGKLPIMAFAPDMKSLDKEATALCGISQYADVKFPEEFRGNFFIGDVVNCRVHRYSYTLNGSTPVGKSETDFVKSEDPWFRPVNIKLGPDGALYIADFYNAIIGHYEVPLGHPKRDKSRGRIWRIAYKGETNEPKDLSQAPLTELLAMLDVDNLPSRMTAADQISDRIGSSSIPSLVELLNTSGTSAKKYIHGLWLLYRLDGVSDEILKKSLAHADPLVRLHTLRVLAELKPDAVTFYPLALNALNDQDAHVQRAATELMMKYPALSSVEAVLALQHRIPGSDTHLNYTTQLCLRNLLRNEDLLKQVAARQWKDDDAASLAFVMVDVQSPLVAGFLSDYLLKNTVSNDKIPLVYKQITRYAPPNDLNKVISGAMQKNEMDVELRSLVFKGIQNGLAERGVKGDPALFNQWGAQIAEGLLKKYPATDTSKSDEVVAVKYYGIQLAGDYQVKSLEEAVLAYIRVDSTKDIGLRVSAFRSLLKISPGRAAELTKSILEDKATTLDFSRRVVRVLGEYPGPQVNKVLGELKNTAPELQTTIVLTLAGSPEGKSIALQQVRKGEFLARTLKDPKVEERMMLDISPAQKKEFDALTASLEPIDKERQTLIESRLKAFKSYRQTSIQLDSGQQVYNKNCGVCHRRVNQTAGTGIGPQLHGIGKRGAEALVEKILDPNRNISEAFRTYTIRLKDGKVLTGLFRRDEGALVIFADLAGKEFSVPRKDIAEQKPSRLTIMPDDFGTSMTKEEFNALLAYLLNS